MVVGNTNQLYTDYTGFACQRPLEIRRGLFAMFPGIRVGRAYKNKGPCQIRNSKNCESTNGIGNVYRSVCRSSLSFPGRAVSCRLAQLKFFETHISLRNVEQLSQIADELKLDDFPLRELTGRHLPSISTLFKNQLRITPTLAGDDFIHIVGTVAQEETHIYVQQGAAHKNVLTVTVHTVDKNHDVHFRLLTYSVEDASHFVVHYSGQRRINLFSLTG